MALTKVKAGNILLTTPAADSNDVTPATTAYVTTALANLADSAPSTLDTLNELAAALGDDANFSTTVTNSIAAKAPLASPTLTGTPKINVGTDKNIIFSGGIGEIGNVPGFQGINDAGSSNTDIGMRGTTIRFATGSSERMRIDSSGRALVGITGASGFGQLETTSFATEGQCILARTGGNVGIGDTSPIAKLTVKAASDTIRAESLATDAKNITMSYHDSNDQGQIFCGEDGVVDKNIVLRGHTLILQRNGGTEAMRIASDGHVSIKGTANASADGLSNLTLGNGVGDAGLSIYSGQSSASRLMFADGTSGGAQYDGFVDYNHSNQSLGLGTGSTGGRDLTINSSGNVGIGTNDPGFLGLTGSGQVLHLGGTNTQLRLANSIIHHDNAGLTKLTIRNNYGATSNSAQMELQAGFITFETGTSFTERMRILSNGVLLFHTDSQSGISNGTSNISCGSLGSGQLVLATNNDIPIILNRALGSGTMLAIRNNGSNVGSITQNGSSTSFNTSSDYRLKENVDYTWDATTRLKQLKPARFNWIADETNTLVDGFLAHEVSSIVPEAVEGEKDGEIDENGNGYQGIDQSKLIPLLTKALQEAMARIETLEAEVTALKG